MKPFYIFLISGLLFLGCSRHPDNKELNVKQQTPSASKTAGKNLSHQAREFTPETIEAFNQELDFT